MNQVNFKDFFDSPKPQQCHRKLINISKLSKINMHNILMNGYSHKKYNHYKIFQMKQIYNKIKLHMINNKVIIIFLNRLTISKIKLISFKIRFQ